MHNNESHVQALPGRLCNVAESVESDEVRFEIRMETRWVGNNRREAGPKRRPAPGEAGPSSARSFEGALFVPSRTDIDPSVAFSPSSLSYASVLLSQPCARTSRQRRRGCVVGTREPTGDATRRRRSRRGAPSARAPCGGATVSSSRKSQHTEQQIRPTSERHWTDHRTGSRP